MGTDQSSIKTHLANNRVSQPLRYGGLAFPDPIIQTQALNFSWARKLQNSSSDLTWVYQINFSLGTLDWRITGEKLRNISDFWSETFITFIIEMSHIQLKRWHLIPIIGHVSIDQIDAFSLVYKNRQAKNIYEAELRFVGQLF